MWNFYGCRRQQVCNFHQFISVDCWIITNKIHVIDNFTSIATNRLIIILSPSWSTKAVLKTGTDCKWLQDGPCHRSNQRPRGCTRLQWSSCGLQPRFSLEWLWYRQLLKVSEGINDGADYLRSFEVFCSRLSWYKLRVHSSSLIQDIFKCTSVPGTADTSFNCFSVFQWASF